MSLSILQCSPPKPDTIHIAAPYELDSLDPHLSSRLGDYAILANFYEPLVITNSGMKIQPCLAKRWENPDIYTWLFHLEPNAKFHDGKSFLAEDVVFTYQRLLDNGELGISSYLSDVLEVLAVDRHTVRIRTRSPLAILLNNLSNVLIIPRGSNPADMLTKENGTGPYRLEAWEPGKRVGMIRNEGYWGKKPPLLRAEYQLHVGPEQVLRELEAGKCQLGQYDSRNFEKSVSALERFEVIRQDNFFLKFISYDVSRDVTPYCSAKPNPFKNVLVRQAVNVAIDRAQLLQKLPTYAAAATQPVPAFVFGFNPEVPAPKYDPAAARDLLARAGYGEGFEITIHVREILRDTAPLIQEQLQKIGIRSKLKVLSDKDFFQALSAGDFSVYISRAGATVGDASDVLEPQFHTKDTARHLGVRNYNGYSNPELDRMIEQSATILETEKRRRVLQDIMLRLTTDLPWVPLYIDQDVYALDKSFSWRPRPDSYILAYEIHLKE